ncbi:MAG TPA: sulfite exporter TauE/SafE family protein, partial [Chitinophagaceae bacterium]|nr:sulfite exporter TauE/SafE family protein [Chitinophagaceae bacterium]
EKLNGDFANKVDKLNSITKVLSTKKEIDNGEKKWRKIATFSLFAFFFMFIGHVILSYVPYVDLWTAVKDLPNQIDNAFYWMILAGFLAQIVDGALGMGYGVTCTIVLLSIGIKLPAISGSIHTAEMFSSGVSGYSHYKFGNVNKKLFKALLIPGILGAILGAFLLSKYGDQYSQYVRPFLAAYTMFLGLKIFLAAFKKMRKNQKTKRVGWLAGAGGFLDSFGGGGWGPLVTSTLISKGRTPKYVIGSVSITEFFVTLASALTFFTFIGISHWQVIVGLIIGGVIAAPIAAKLVGKLPLKTMMISVGVMVMLWSIRLLLKSLGV